MSDLNDRLKAEIEKQKARIKALEASPNALSLSELLAPILQMVLKVALDSLESEIRDRLNRKA